MNSILKRLPDWQSIIGVYATAVFVIYGWMLFRSFWKVPSWMFFLSLGEILSVYAYSFVVAFIESMVVLAVLILVGFVLPAGWWNDRFTSLGMIWLIVVEGSIMLRLYEIRAPAFWEEFVYNQGAWWATTLALALVLSLVVSRINWLRKGFELFAERLVVFLYFYMPITGISFLVVILRNVI